mgnify:CR=1 FL=1
MLRTVLFTILFLPLAAVAQSDEDLQVLYTRFLEDRGYETGIDSDGDVTFKIDGRTYFIETADSDLQYFRMALPNIWPIESEKERIQATAAANKATAQLIVAKVYVVNDNVWVATEILLGSYKDFALVFDRCLDLIDNGVDAYVSGMQ